MPIPANSSIACSYTKSMFLLLLASAVLLPAHCSVLGGILCLQGTEVYASWLAAVLPLSLRYSQTDRQACH